MTSFLPQTYLAVSIQIPEFVLLPQSWSFHKFKMLANSTLSGPLCIFSPPVFHIKPDFWLTICFLMKSWHVISPLLPPFPHCFPSNLSLFQVECKADESCLNKTLSISSPLCLIVWLSVSYFTLWAWTLSSLNCSIWLRWFLSTS
jgi:hypothetical protein